MDSTGKLVCVTGASGYIASWIVKFLLDRGYTVRATVRDPSNPKKVDHLLQLAGAKERLQLFKADLMQEGSFDSAIQGCNGVFHTASPVLVNDIKDPQVELIDPAVKGTLNVLKSCAKSPSVKRVVLTSSLAAVACNIRVTTPNPVIDETWFSQPELCRQLQEWYMLSKTLAEDEAWKFVKENNIDMVSINPGVCVGPLLQPEVNESVAPIYELINGEPFPSRRLGWVDVRDVAECHILAYENASASGRYLLVERSCHGPVVPNILRDLYPTLQITDKLVQEDGKLMPKFTVSNEKAKRLGVRFTPLEVSLKDTVESLREKKILKF